MALVLDGTSGVTLPAGGTGNTAGAVVGTTDTQTLTNKTLATPSITGNTTSTGTFTESSRAAAMGYWTNVAYSAGNFTASGSMTWTVDSGDQTVYKYALIGKTMILCVVINTSTVGGTLGQELRLAIPGGYTAVAQSAHPVNIYQTSWVLSAATVNTSYIAFFVAPTFASNWVASTNLTAVQGTFMFEVA